MPAEIRALSALNHLSLCGNALRGELPPELGNLTSLTVLFLNNNSISGAVPSSFSKLTNLHYIYLYNNKFTTDIPFSYIHGEEKVQTYLYTTFRHPTIRYVITAITITNRRLSSCLIHPTFTFLANNQDVTSTVLSFLGQEEFVTCTTATLH